MLDAQIIVLAVSTAGTLLGVWLGYVLSGRSAQDEARRDRLLALRRLLSRDLDVTLLLQRRLKEGTGPVDAAVTRWTRLAEADVYDLHLFADLADLGEPSSRMRFLVTQSELARAIQSGDQREMLEASEELLIELMRLSAEVDARLGIRSGTRREWEREKGEWRPG